MLQDKKISELDPIDHTGLSLEDLFAIVPIGAAATFKTTLGDLQRIIQTNAGAQTFFSYGVPQNVLGKDGDVYFDISTQNIYQKTLGVWELKIKLQEDVTPLDFVATQGQVTFQHNLLIGAKIQEIYFDGFRNAIAYTLNATTGVITFAELLNANCKISIIHS